jgi:hypothetical protein
LGKVLDIKESNVSVDSVFESSFYTGLALNNKSNLVVDLIEGGRMEYDTFKFVVINFNIRFFKLKESAKSLKLEISVEHKVHLLKVGYIKLRALLDRVGSVDSVDFVKNFELVEVRLVTRVMVPPKLPEFLE